MILHDNIEQSHVIGMFQVFSIDIAPYAKDEAAVFLWYLDSFMISQSTTAAICESRRKRLFVLPFASFDVEELDFVGVARTEPTANEQDLSGRNLGERMSKYTFPEPRVVDLRPLQGPEVQFVKIIESRVVPTTVDEHGIAK